jgi:cyclopropane-fatty-acyl-phospholipid synthase
MLSSLSEKIFTGYTDNLGIDVWREDSYQRDIYLFDPDTFYSQLMRGGSRTFWEMFVQGIWHSPDLAWLIAKLTSPKAIAMRPAALRILENTIEQCHRLMTHPVLRRSQSFDPTKVGAEHYDIGADFYFELLGLTAKYTSAYHAQSMWPFDLDLFQSYCMEVLCQRLNLPVNKSDTMGKNRLEILEIGFGNGTLAAYAQKNYDANVTGLTISEWQRNWAREVFTKNDVPNEGNNFRIQDWKDLYTNKKSEFDEHYKERYDGIVSVEMIEAVSTHDLPLFFRFLSDCLKPGGIVVIQAINSPRKVYSGDGFLNKFIFPSGVVPQYQNIINCAEKVWLQTGEVDNSLGPAYAHTLRAWWERFEKMPKEIRTKYYDFYANKWFPGKENFIRIWQYYLQLCEGAFRSGYNQDGHFVFTKWAPGSAISISSRRGQVEEIMGGRYIPWVNWQLILPQHMN